MKSLAPAILAHHAKRKGRNASALLWIMAKNRATEVVEGIGIWGGPDDLVFTIDGENRTYFGGGAVLNVPDIKSEVGLRDRGYTIKLSSIDDRVKALFANYDIRNAPIELHEADFQLDSFALISEPERSLTGRVRQAPFSEPPVGGEASVSIKISGAVVYLTKPLALKKSDAALKERQPVDDFRQYIDATGVVESVWGEMRSKSSS